MNTSPDVTNETRPRCKRCLLREMDKDAYFQSIYEYIASIREEDKVSDAEYQRRLSICKSCANLINGMCAVCGCFVEVRAIKRMQHCAQNADLW